MPLPLPPPLVPLMPGTASSGAQPQPAVLSAAQLASEAPPAAPAPLAPQPVSEAPPAAPAPLALPKPPAPVFLLAPSVLPALAATNTAVSATSVATSPTDTPPQPMHSTAPPAQSAPALTTAAAAAATPIGDGTSASATRSMTKLTGRIISVHPQCGTKRTHDGVVGRQLPCGRYDVIVPELQLTGEQLWAWQGRDWPSATPHQTTRYLQELENEKTSQQLRKKAADRADDCDANLIIPPLPTAASLEGQHHVCSRVCFLHAARDTWPYGPLAEPTITGFGKDEMALWLSQSVLRNQCAFNPVRVQIIDSANTPQYIVAVLTQQNLRQSVPGAVQFDLHGFAQIAADLRELLAHLNWSQFDVLRNTQPTGTRRMLSLADLLPRLKEVTHCTILINKCGLVVQACKCAVHACCIPFGIATTVAPALLLTQKGSPPGASHVDQAKSHGYSGVIAVTPRPIDFRLHHKEPRYVKQQLEVKDDIHQANIFEAARCHRGAGDSGDSQTVLTLCPDAAPQRPRNVEIVSIGLHFYAGHGDRTPKELSVCHADSTNGKSNYGFHPDAPCFSMEQLL